MPPIRAIAASLALAAAGLGASPTDARAQNAALPQIVASGSIALPDAAVDAEGDEVRLTGISGITWLGDDRYAAIMDNSDVVITFSLTLSPEGEPTAVANLAVIRLAERHDYEDLAPCPAPLQKRIAARQQRRGKPEPTQCLLVCEEDTPAIRAISLDDGSLLGVVPIPPPLDRPRVNRGLESLAVDSDGAIWTANEEALPNDGPAAGDGGTIVRLTRIMIPEAGQPAAEPVQHAYAVDLPHEFMRLLDGQRFSGVVALVPLGRERLLVFERSAGAGLPPFENRIAVIDTAAAPNVASITKDLASQRERVIAKSVVWRDQPGCNLEGLCLGPPLRAGGRALVAVADNGGIGGPNTLMVLRLDDE
ncbi:MAG: esterase-like activity of phytase family protein [Pirellulales bacterium]